MKAMRKTIGHRRLFRYFPPGKKFSQTPKIYINFMIFFFCFLSSSPSECLEKAEKFCYRLFLSWHRHRHLLFPVCPNESSSGISCAFLSFWFICPSQHLRAERKEIIVCRLFWFRQFSPFILSSPSSSTFFPQKKREAFNENQFTVVYIDARIKWKFKLLFLILQSAVAFDDCQQRSAKKHFLGA